MLRRLGKDIHSPKYVCPTDLHREHDKRESELRKQREKEEKAKKCKKAMEDEKRFHELKSKFFGISFTDGTIQVHVLESVQEHLEEGVAMHHCVFDNAYYLRENSLIFSATIEGRRIETIEVNLDTDRKSTRLNSSHANISYAVFCLKKTNTGRKTGLGSPSAKIGRCPSE